jgi:hypothetical protein
MATPDSNIIAERQRRLEARMARVEDRVERIEKSTMSGGFLTPQERETLWLSFIGFVVVWSVISDFRKSRGKSWLSTSAL